MLTPFASIIRIALRLLLSSVAMFCIGPRAIAFFFLSLAVTLIVIVYRICQVDGTPISILWISGDQGCVSHVISISGIVTSRDYFLQRE